MGPCHLVGPFPISLPNIPAKSVLQTCYNVIKKVNFTELKGKMQLKSTGIARSLDSMGRLVLPKELRDVMDIRGGESLEVFIDGSQVILRKFMHNCVFCGEGADVQFYHDIAICPECAEDLYNKVRT
jgi:transcriptional pleiotropic regulator of transition state genes